MSDRCCFFSVQDAFFCRVYDILEHGNFSKLVVEEKKLEKNLEEEKILKENEAEMIKRNLKQYIKHRNVRIFTEGPTRHLSARAAVLSVCLLSR